MEGSSTSTKHSKLNPWYHAELDSQHIGPEARKLLKEYSHIPPDEVNDHIYKMRDILWAQGPYPCIGEFRFLTINILKNPVFPRIISILTPKPTTNLPKPTFLSLGCCIAQDLRYLSSIGIPSSNLYGSDINNSFLSTSFLIFRDHETFKGTLIAADVFSPSLFQDDFLGWEGKFDVVHAACFLHLFEWEKQVEIGRSVVRLLRPGKGVMFVGEMMGIKGGGLARTNSAEGKEGVTKNYLHDPETFEGLWFEVAERSGTTGQWHVDAQLKIGNSEKGRGSFFVGEGRGWLTFSVERV